jgi:hypothetical protein
VPAALAAVPLYRHRSLSGIFRSRPAYGRPDDKNSTRPAFGRKDAAISDYGKDLRHAGQLRSPEYIRAGLNRELDKYTVWPDDESQAQRAA